MKRLLFVFALFVSFASLYTLSAIALEIGETSETTPITEVSFADGVETTTLVRDTSAVSVPEPATFGLISIALAVGGGLMIRRKAD